MKRLLFALLPLVGCTLNVNGGGDTKSSGYTPQEFLKGYEKELFGSKKIVDHYYGGTQYLENYYHIYDITIMTQDSINSFSFTYNYYCYLKFSENKAKYVLDDLLEMRFSDTSVILYA